jgi:hypothetical protein
MSPFWGCAHCPAPFLRPARVFRRGAFIPPAGQSRTGRSVTAGQLPWPALPRIRYQPRPLTGRPPGAQRPAAAGCALPGTTRAGRSLDCGLFTSIQPAPWPPVRQQRRTPEVTGIGPPVGAIRRKRRLSQVAAEPKPKRFGTSRSRASRSRAEVGAPCGNVAEWRYEPVASAHR